MKILTLKEFEGKKLGDVLNHILKNNLKVASIEGFDLEQLPKDEKNYFFFGSLVRCSNGDWDAPYAYWGGSEWHRHANWLVDDWYSYCRVVLLDDNS